MAKRKNGTIFVTVGTTLFNRLVESVTTEQALDWMEKNGYTRLIVQYGKGNKPTIPDKRKSNTLEVELYDFKSSLAPDMAKADLILSHAGAGTVSEALQQQQQHDNGDNINHKRRLVVVVNTLLMDNHQLELALAMKRRDYLYVVESPDLLQDMTVWNEFEQFQPRPPDPTDPLSFANILNAFFEVDKEN